MSQTSLMEKGYLIIENVLSKEYCEFISNYALFKSKIKPSVKRRQDPLLGIHREYGDHLMESLISKITPTIEKAIGLELWPTLSFYYVYKKGNKLLPHKDRSSCQFVAGLYVGCDEEFQKKGDGWPLMINYQGKQSGISLKEGDIVIFKGHETEHWRESFTGTWFISAIFGFVDKKGPFAFQKYDQRKMLGKPHVGMFRWLYGCGKQNIKNFARSLMKIT